MVDIRIDYLDAANYALVHNGIPVCHSLEITNNSDNELHNIFIECSGDFIKSTQTGCFPIVKKGQTLKINNFEITPIPQKVAALTERTTTYFTIQIWQKEPDEEKTSLLKKEFPIDIMAFDQWLGSGVHPQMLASFVLPNNPEVNNLIVKAAQHLKRSSGASSFTAYQSGNPQMVEQQVAAIFGALHEENIVYRSLPASFEGSGQRITLANQVLTNKLGNCIELSLLFASALECIGIHSVIILQREHAFLGVWLVDDCCPYSVSDDSSYLEKKCSEGINEMMVLECTSVTSESASFKNASESALKKLADLSKFEMYVDIQRCRLERIRPLPQVVNNNNNWTLEVPEGVEHDECNIQVQKRSRYDLTNIFDSNTKLSKMDIWERKLLDFSLRNTLLNLSLSQKAIQFISFNVNLLEDALQDGKEYMVCPKPDINFQIPDEERIVRSRLIPDIRELVSTDLKNQLLHTYCTESKTKDVLKNIYRLSRNAIEETGANSLFLAIGALRWFETEDSTVPHYAPIMMLPVEIVYKKSSYYLRSRDEEITLNITLFEYLRQSHEIDIPGLNPLPTDEHGVDVAKIFAIIRSALEHKKQWDVEEECILGIFSFSKFVMWSDIHNHRKELLSNEIIHSLVEQKLTWQPQPLISDLKSTDREQHPDEIALPVSADSSQMTAVIEAGKGNSFILYGPPGTGKSQTITNLIANALYQGKRVLFVAEKMAALSVVQKRLEKIGLDPFCLEMHSNKITKRHVLEQLNKALKVTHIKQPEEYQRIAAQLYEQRTKLIRYMEALHNVDSDDDFSLYDCILRYDSLDAEILDFDTKDPNLRAHFRPQSVEGYRHLLNDKYRLIVNLIGQPSEHPLLGLNIHETDLGNIGGLTASLESVRTTLNNGYNDYERLCNAPALRAEILKEWAESIFNEDIDKLSQEWKSIRVKGFLTRYFAKKSFIKKMRTFNPYILEEDLLSNFDKIAAYNDIHRTIIEIQTTINSYFSNSYGFDEMPPKEDLQQLIAKLNSWLSHTDKARDWYQWCAFKDEMRSIGLGVLTTTIEKQSISGDNLNSAFLKTMFKALALEKIAVSPLLRTFEGSIFDATVLRYKELTNEFQLLSQKELYAKLAAQIPHVTDNVDTSSEIGLLNRNVSNGGRKMSLRELMNQIPTLLPRLCPCMLMSPLSVAQFLSLSQEKFDLVIFDEASQMPTSEAVGAIARGKALIVVGDPKQMPPTSFFNSTCVNEEEADIDDMESILEDCRTLEIPSLQLNWHYRSRHESLIAFSNNEYYDGSLITFPSVDDQNTKVKFIPVDGVYDKGGRRSNRKEAEAIVAEIIRRLKDPSAKRSIGVIAFNVVQQNLIEDLLQEQLDKKQELKNAADSLYEPIFIKNLENVQGDERDVILFSIGYGPDKEGKISMNFGPLNNSGGERRLNVAVSRARHEMLIFSTMRAAHIDLRRTQARGVIGLKHFLEYAERQTLVPTANTINERPDSIVAKQIALALEQRGYHVRTDVGRSDFKVDIAISNPAHDDLYSVGLLLDGKGYHQTQTTRDREIVQPSVLESLQWRIMRIWSVDWMVNPERLLNRIEEFVKSKPTPTEPEKPVSFNIDNEEVVEATSNELPYNSYTPTNLSTMSDHELAKAIVAVEQPITVSLLCREICRFREIARVTQSLTNDIRAYAKRYLFLHVTDHDETVWTNREAFENFSGYRQSNGRDIDDIPFIEIQNALLETVQDQVSTQRDNLPTHIARKLGFARTGTKVESTLKKAIEQMLQDGRIVDNNGRITLADA